MNAGHVGGGPDLPHDPTDPAAALARAGEWNTEQPVGTLVRFWPGARTGPGRIGITERPAHVLGGTAVVFIRDEQRARPIAVTHAARISGPVDLPCRGLHRGFPVPAETGEAFGQHNVDIDMAAMGQLVTAGFDSCVPCGNRWVDVVAADPLTTARIVVTAAICYQTTFGGIPPALLKEGPHHTAVTSPSYRALLRAGVDKPHQRDTYTAAAAMSDDQRRDAVNDAADTIVAHLGIEAARVVDGMGGGQ